MHISPIGTGDGRRERGVIRRESGFSGRGSDFKVHEPSISALNLDGRTRASMKAVDGATKSSAVDGGAFSGITLDDDRTGSSAGELGEKDVTFTAGNDSLGQMGVYACTQPNGITGFDSRRVIQGGLQIPGTPDAAGTR